MDPTKLNNIQLIGTSINILEISSTRNIINDINLIVEVIKALQVHSEIIISNPFEHLITIFNEGYIPNNKYEEITLNQFDRLINLDTSTIKSEDYENALNLIRKFSEPQEQIVDYINIGLSIVRQNLKRKEGKNQHRKKDTSQLTKKLISEFVLIYSKKCCDREYIIDVDDERWKYLDFFVYTWEAYFKILEIEERKLDINDWQDLFNLVYVQPGNKYWTFEKKWNDIFDKNPILSEYKFTFINPDGD